MHLNQSMELNKRIVVFDFCETLVDIQSADKFIDYVIEKENYRKYAFINTIIFLLTRSRALALINKFFPKLNLSKRLKLYQIKGMSSTIINAIAIRYYNEILVHHKIVSIHELLLRHIANKDHVLNFLLLQKFNFIKIEQLVSFQEKIVFTIKK